MQGLTAKRAYLVLLLGALVSSTSFILLVVAENSSGDAATAYGFASLAGFVFIALPTLLVSLICAVLAKPASAALYVSLAFLTLWHLFIADKLGFFDRHKNQITEQRAIADNPARYLLRQSILTGRQADLETLQQALAMGADPNASFHDEVRLPILVVLASRGDHRAMSELLKAGADPNARSQVAYQGIRAPVALDLVLFAEVDDEQAMEAMQTLLDAGAATDETLLPLGACHRGDLALYQTLRTSGVPQRTDDKGNTCLHSAIAIGQAEFVKAYLLSRSHRDEAVASMNQPNKLGQNPLDLAALKGHPQIIQALLDNGATATSPATQSRIDMHTN